MTQEMSNPHVAPVVQRLDNAIHQARVVQKVDDAIQWIAWFVLSTLIHWIAIYLMDSVIGLSSL